jgi:hypothetical protein
MWASTSAGRPASEEISPTTTAASRRNAGEARPTFTPLACPTRGARATLTLAPVRCFVKTPSPGTPATCAGRFPATFSYWEGRNVFSSTLFYEGLMAPTYQLDIYIKGVDT